MKRMPMKPLLRAVVMLTALAPALPAAAQYVWIDDKGTRHFSDMPPPASIPDSRILRQPGKRSSDADSAAADKAEPAGPTLAERNAEFRKRRAEQAEKEKKAAEDAAHAADRSRNCERAREYQRTIDSGVRIARTDRNGERSFLTDEQREQESRETRKLLDDCR